MSNNFENSTRPPVICTNGMVSSAHPLASNAGVKILMNGGNAFDAAVGVAFALGVVEPYMSGPGGIGLALITKAGANTPEVLNFSGMAPKLATLENFKDVENSVYINGVPNNVGIKSGMVPGNLAGWFELHNKYGSLDLEVLMDPAIHYAEEGFPVSKFAHDTIKLSVPILSKYPSANIYMGKSGIIPKIGSVIKLPQFAKSLKAIQKYGKDVFYRGYLAEKMVQGSEELGGLLSLEDLESYEPYWQTPIKIKYKDYEIYTTPPNSSGFQLLQIMKMIETYSEGQMDLGSADTLHLMIEISKLCVADRVEYAGDPKFVTAPLKQLLSNQYANRQKSRLDLNQAQVVAGDRYVKNKPLHSLSPGDVFVKEGGLTTHFSVADKDRNVISVTQTLGGAFGTGAALYDTGIFLNNMGSYFDEDAMSPNVIAPGKEVDFVVAPTQVYRNGHLVLSIGTPGGYGILHTTPQILNNILNHNMNIQQAIEVPRFRLGSGLDVDIEDRFGEKILNQLIEKGHNLNNVGPWSRTVGGAQGIFIDDNAGAYWGGSDPRRDGYSIGW